MPLDAEQYEFLNDRIDHLEKRIGQVEDGRDQTREEHHARRSYFWEVLIGLLVMVEAVFEILMYLQH